jgi:hypothetical protein
MVRRSTGTKRNADALTSGGSTVRPFAMASSWNWRTLSVSSITAERFAAANAAAWCAFM